MKKDEEQGPCPLLEGCCFFNDVCENMPAPSEYLKIRYCRSDYRSCARHIVYSRTAGEGVPSDLFPHESERTEKIIRAYRHHQEDRR